MTDRDTITLPREVVKFVLQHLEWWSDDEPQEKEAITALRTAIAAEQPKQEPVAWRPRLSPNLCFHWSRPWSEGVPLEQTVDYWNQKGAGVEYAYAAPPDAEALRRDAERYRWLKAKVEDYDGHACFPQVPYPAPIPDCSPFDAVDAAIDAAMKEGKR